MATKQVSNPDADTNPDPITGEPGSHPMGTGLGAAGAGAAGAAIGSMAGPIGTAVGAVVGAVAGGLAGKAAAEAIDPTAEDSYWRQNHSNRPYAKGSDYASYQPAYRYGWEARSRHPEASFDDVQDDLETEWAEARGTSKLEWQNAKLAARDAWDRISTSPPRKAK